MAKITLKSKNPNAPTKLSVKDNIHIARSKKYKKIMLSSITLNILLIISLFLTTIR